MVDFIEIIFTAGFWAATLRIACPLILATLGEMLCERAGVLNLGIEGIMSIGAMVGWMTVFLGADLYTGILAALIIGGIFGLLHAIFTVYLGASQHVTGIGITMLASSLGFFCFKLILPSSTTPPKIKPFQPIDIPFLSELPSEFILAITLPTSITSLDSANISSITPEAGEGISESTLSVPISKRVSSFSIDSPTFLYHSSIVPSVILSPIFGIITSIII